MSVAAEHHADHSPYASLLVSTDVGPDARHRLQVAFDLAHRFSSHVIGIASREILINRYEDGAVTMAADIVDIEVNEVERDLAQAQALFNEVADGYSDIEWRTAMAPPLSHFLELARAADLAIVGGPQTSANVPPGMRFDTGAAVLAAGRPLLVVPPGISRVTGRKIVVAWKDCREARRAVADAMPFLEIADEVHVVIVGHDAEDAGAKDISAFLTRHGVKCAVSVRPTSAFIAGEEILRVASQVGADLVVSGAYGHSRLREWVLGGVTRHLLHNATMACLFSH